MQNNRKCSLNFFCSITIPEMQSSHQQPGMYGFNSSTGIPPFPGGFGNFMNYAASYGQQFHQGSSPFQSNNFGQSLPTHNQHQTHYTPPQHSQGGLVHNLRTVELPFFDLIKVYIFIDG